MQSASSPRIRTPQKLTAEKVQDRAIKRGKGQNENTFGQGGRTPYNFGQPNKPVAPYRGSKKPNPNGTQVKPQVPWAYSKV